MSFYSDGSGTYVIHTEDLNAVAEMLQIGWRQQHENQWEYGVFAQDTYPAPLDNEEPALEAFVEKAKALEQDGAYRPRCAFYSMNKAMYMFNDYAQCLETELKSTADFTIDLEMVEYSEIDSGSIHPRRLHWERREQQFRYRVTGDAEYPYNARYCDEFGIGEDLYDLTGYTVKKVLGHERFEKYFDGAVEKDAELGGLRALLMQRRNDADFQQKITDALAEEAEWENALEFVYDATFWFLRPPVKEALLSAAEEYQ